MSHYYAAVGASVGACDMWVRLIMRWKNGCAGGWLRNLLAVKGLFSMVLGLCDNRRRQLLKN